MTQLVTVKKSRRMTEVYYLTYRYNIIEYTKTYNINNNTKTNGIANI